MSLRYQINLRIFFSSFCVLLLGGSISIWHARNAVEKEVHSSIDLAVQLITFDLSKVAKSPFNETDWLLQFNALDQTKHLSLKLVLASGEIIKGASNLRSNLQDKPPQWFVNLVKSPHPKAEYQITSFEGKKLTLIVESNSIDEITEAWQESMGFFTAIFLLTLFTFLAVNLAFNKAIKSIAIIVEALKIIERGQYQKKLPDFSIQEYDSIAKAINHLASELNTSQQENRALTQHSLEIQEDERARLSQELHDELGQSLTAIKVMAVAAERSQAANIVASQPIKKSTDAIISVCDHLMKVVRSMMHQLHPLVLTELGLKATLEDLLTNWAMRDPELKISLNFQEEVDTLDHKIIIQVFRVIQECLTNIVRHAQAKQASICLEIVQSPAMESVLFLSVMDDGQGCSIEKIKTGFGLLGMRERINSLAGEMTIKTAPNEGMVIIATIPLK